MEIRVWGISCVRIVVHNAVTIHICGWQWGSLCFPTFGTPKETYRYQAVCNRLLHEASCPFLSPDSAHRFPLRLKTIPDARVERMLKCVW